MARLIPTLPRELQTQFPRGIWKIGNTYCRHLNRLDFLIVLAMQTLSTMLDSHTADIRNVFVQMDNLETGLTRRIIAHIETAYLFRLHLGAHRASLSLGA